jgi:hypothetical protein
MAFVPAFPPRNETFGARVEIRASAKTWMAGHLRDEVPGGGHDEVTSFVDKPRAQVQAWQLVFRKLSRARNYVNENISVEAPSPASDCSASRKSHRFSDLNPMLTKNFFEFKFVHENSRIL